ncbi:MAG: rod-binding protein [Smithellaceae bacterium]
MNIIDLNIPSTVGQAKNTEIASKQKQDDLQKIKKACKDFESVFTYYLLKTMRQTVPKGSSFGSSSGKDTYYMLMDQKVAEELSNKGGGLGLQKMLFEQLTKNYPKEVPQEKIK